MMIRDKGEYAFKGKECLFMVSPCGKSEPGKVWLPTILHKEADTSGKMKVRTGNDVSPLRK